MDKPTLICITGLPRSGSTLLAQLLGHHPDIYSVGHSSPLCPAVDNIRAMLSKNDFNRSQLDVDFDLVYQRMGNAIKGFIQGWFEETDLPVVADKNRGWLRIMPLLEHLEIDYRMLVCIRDLGQVFGSVEAQHQKTLLLDFADGTDAYGPLARANQLFGRSGVIGSPLRYIEDLQDVLTAERDKKLFFVPFENLTANPEKSTEELFDWLDVKPFEIDTSHLKVKPGESDSFYNFKYRHATRESMGKPEMHVIPRRVEDGLKKNFKWYYERFYPKKLAA